ncbi:zinc finger protein 496-like [Ornithorhynchus anatinus]|uniref:zinc finger protein 496-like n=1 Tax=Ornithorhynchus anatinus TaxID=9258 RepID=UPI0019D4BCCF|nr:zinc finger protein 496-like [Ornithorhynchus anatinus]
MATTERRRPPVSSESPASPVSHPRRGGPTAGGSARVVGPSVEGSERPPPVKTEEEEEDRGGGFGPRGNGVPGRGARRFRFREASGPREALGRPQQTLQPSVLDRFLAILPAEIQARVRFRRPESGEEAVAPVEGSHPEPGGTGPQTRSPRRRIAIVIVVLVKRPLRARHRPERRGGVELVGSDAAPVPRPVPRLKPPFHRRGR